MEQQVGESYLRIYIDLDLKPHPSSVIYEVNSAIMYLLCKTLVRCLEFRGVRYSGVASTLVR